MEWAQWGLDVLRVLVWPVTVAVLVWWLKEPIRKRFGDVQKVTALGVEVEWAERQVEQGVRELSEVFTDPDKAAAVADEAAAHDEVVAEVTGPLEPKGPPQVVHPDPIHPQLSDAQRKAIGELVQQAAEWGSVRAQAGLSVQGAKLKWENGVPQLVTPSTLPRRASVAEHWTVRWKEAPDDPVRLLEERVDELDQERRKAQVAERLGVAGAARDRAIAEQRHAEAVNRLRSLDPDSPDGF